MTHNPLPKRMKFSYGFWDVILNYFGVIGLVILVVAFWAMHLIFIDIHC